MNICMLGPKHFHVRHREQEKIVLNGIPLSVESSSTDVRMLTLVMCNVSLKFRPSGTHKEIELPKSLTKSLEQGIFAATSTYRGGPSVCNILSAVALIRSYIRASSIAELTEELYYPRIAAHGFFNGDVFILMGVGVDAFYVDLTPEVTN